jgi:hypothetical protein
LLSSLGLSLLLDQRYLMPVMLVALVLAIAALAFRAERRNGYGPACIGSLAALIVLVGKFSMQSVPLTFSGIGALTAAAIWNIWPRKTSVPTVPLATCCPPEPRTNEMPTKHP